MILLHEYYINYYCYYLEVICILLFYFSISVSRVLFHKILKKLNECNVSLTCIAYNNTLPIECIFVFLTFNKTGNKSVFRS